MPTGLRLAMSKSMDGKERRQRVLDLLAESDRPLSGTTLAEECGVSRQVIVQDVALLRSAGHDIASTNRGYVLVGATGGTGRVTRLVKVHHGPDQVEEEMDLIVDLGGTVDDVLVNHRTYGRVSAPLGVSSRRDVRRFMDDLASSKSSLLSTTTSGYHYHHLSAPDEATLDEIEAALRDRGFLADRLPYEVEEGL